MSSDYSTWDQDNEMDEYWPDDSGDCYTCPECHGEGYIVICCDDICVGNGECMHGSDGEMDCPECDGEGEIWE